MLCPFLTSSVYLESSGSMKLSKSIFLLEGAFSANVSVQYVNTRDGIERRQLALVTLYLRNSFGVRRFNLLLSLGSRLLSFCIPYKCPPPPPTPHPKSMGISVWIVTGDNRATAEAVAATVGIPRGKVMASVLPVDKARKVIQEN